MARVNHGMVGRSELQARHGSGLWLLTSLLGVLLCVPAFAQGTVRPWMVELTDPSAAQVYSQERSAALAAGADSAAAHGRATTEARRQIQRLEGEQHRVLASLRARLGTEVQVVGQVQRVYNGILVLADPTLAEAARGVPGVHRVHPVAPKQRTNSTSVPFVGTPSTWADFGVTGSGVRIGIIDSGVDYLHTGLGGSGLAGDYAANDTTSLDGFFPSAKVVDGWDFVGDAYDAASDDPGTQTPMPDPDPMDCDGHGTHVAGTAAAFGTNGDGTTFLGPWDETTPFDTLGIGPGVAPEASLVALRVFGCSGETAVVEMALEWAVDPNDDGDFSDRLDVVNLSLTSPFSGPEDPTAVAATNAASVGVVVVAAAGNEGDQHFAIGSPAVAEGVLAVAASWDDDDTFPARAVRIESPPSFAGTHQAGGANFGPALATPLTADGVLADPADACTPLQNSAAEIDGKIAVIDRSDDCTYVTQVRHAQQAGTTGAIGVVIVNDRDGLEGVFDDGTGGDITIPPLMIRQVAGQGLQQALLGTAEVTLTPAILADMAGSFSSRGPRRGAIDNPRDLSIAPQIAAPGVAITSLRVGDAISGGTASMVLSGTSMATPHVAGAAALLRQARPTWEPAAIAAALSQTSTEVTFDPEGTPPLMSPVRMGAGRLQTGPALATEVVAFDASHPDRIGVSFGLPEGTPGGTGQTGKNLRFQNRGATDVSFDLDLRVQEPVIGITLSLDGETSITVPAGGEAFLQVRLGFNGGVLRHQRDPTLDPSTFGFPRHWLTEVAAWVEATPTTAGAVPLRVPVYLAPRPASTVRGVAARDGGRSNFVLNLSGLDLEGGSDTTFWEQGRVTALELQYEDFSGDPFALRHIGVGSDFLATGDLAASRLLFGFSAVEPWATPHAVRAEVLVDTDRNGFADFVLTNSDRGSEAFNFVTDAFVSVLHDLGSGTSSVQEPLAVLSPEETTTRPLASRVMVLPVSIAELGLAPSASRFDYAIDYGPRETGGAIAELQRGDGIAMPSDTFTWDPEAPGVSFAGGFEGAPIWPDLSNTYIPVAVDTDAFGANQSLGVLLLHHHNFFADQSDAVDLDLLEDALIFADGFEVGGTDLWSVTAP